MNSIHNLRNNKSKIVGCLPNSMFVFYLTAIPSFQFKILPTPFFFSDKYCFGEITLSLFHEKILLVYTLIMEILFFLLIVGLGKGIWVDLEM